MAAPYIFLSLLVLALLVGWWIAKKRARARIDGLNATISGLNGTISNLTARNAVSEERLNYVKERERDVRRANIELENERDELKREIAANASKETIAFAVQRIDMAITKVSLANNALANALTTLNLTTAPPIR